MSEIQSTKETSKVTLTIYDSGKALSTGDTEEFSSVDALREYVSDMYTHKSIDLPDMWTRAEEIEAIDDMENFEDRYGQEIAHDDSYAFCVRNYEGEYKWFRTLSEAEEGLADACWEYIETILDGKVALIVMQ